MIFKRIDRLIMLSFISPFLLTTAVATFILLIQYMLKYFDDFVGKDLGFSVFAELIMYFSVNMMSLSIPLGVLVSSLMTFGNLGEHFELTAIKGSGISLVRALRPIFIFVFFLSIADFFFLNHVVPAANLKAYSLLYDIKHTKPALDIKPGVFYNGIPDYSIKAKEKLPDNKTLKEVLIYDHTQRLGNKSVIVADSSRMFTFANDRYLKLELYEGHAYKEDPKKSEPVDYFYRTNFDHMEIVFDLSSFGLKDTDEGLFRNNRQMKNVKELSNHIDSLNRSIDKVRARFFNGAKNSLKFHLDDIIDEEELKGLTDPKKPEKKEPENSPSRNPKDLKIKKVEKASIFSLGWLLTVLQSDSTVVDTAVDSVWRAPTWLRLVGLEKEEPEPPLLPLKLEEKEERIAKHSNIFEFPIDSLLWKDLDVHFNANYRKRTVSDYALGQARGLKAQLSSAKLNLNNILDNRYRYEVEMYKKYSLAFACIVMFLIGAPLGAIIKKGGLGVPVIVSIFFFITYYVINITMEKWAKAGVTDPIWSVWVADGILLPIGLFFLRQARIDARLFDTDFYHVVIDKIKMRLKKRKSSVSS